LTYGAVPSLDLQFLQKWRLKIFSLTAVFVLLPEQSNQALPEILRHRNLALSLCIFYDRFIALSNKRGQL